MKFALSQARALLIGVALIVVTNAVVLAGVAYNRSGEPESVLRLTERELSIRNWNWPENENSSIDLRLSWRVASGDTDGREWDYGLYWLKDAQLRELGFDVVDDVDSDAGKERVYKQPSRRAWLVLEYDGPAYQKALAIARKAAERAAARTQANPGDSELQERLNSARGEVRDLERFASRLFVVDAGRDAAALRKRYPDRQHYVVVGGRLDVVIGGPTEHDRMVAQVIEIDAGTIRVPNPYRAIVEPFVQDNRYSNREPRFAATVNFGRRFEPWISDLKLLD